MFRFVLLSFLALCPGCSTIRQRVEWASYPGAFKRGACAQYAASVALRLQGQGIDARYVEFEWGQGHAHALVIFQNGTNWCLIDNQTPYPRPLHYTTNTLAMVRRYFPEAKKIRQ